MVVSPVIPIVMDVLPLYVCNIPWNIRIHLALQSMPNFCLSFRVCSGSFVKFIKIHKYFVIKIFRSLVTNCKFTIAIQINTVLTYEIWNFVTAIPQRKTNTQTPEGRLHGNWCFQDWHSAIRTWCMTQSCTLARCRWTKSHFIENSTKSLCLLKCFFLSNLKVKHLLNQRNR